MTKLFHGVLFMLAAFAMALPAHAGKGGGTGRPRSRRAAASDNTVYVGINWNFGVRDGATAVLGYRDAKVKANNNVDGWKVEATCGAERREQHRLRRAAGEVAQGRARRAGRARRRLLGRARSVPAERRRARSVRQRQRRLPVRQGLALLDRREHPGQGEEAEGNVDLPAGLHPRRRHLLRRRRRSRLPDAEHARHGLLPWRGD